MKRWMSLVLGVLMVWGCASQNDALQMGNEKLTPENIAAVEVGMQKSQLLSSLGQPDDVVPVAGGSEVWLYRGAEGEWVRPSALSRKTTTLHAKSLAVTVGPDGVVSNVDYEQTRETTKKPF